MNKKIIVLGIIFVLAIIFTVNTNCYAADLDEIINYVVTVEPRMNDGSLDITYEITWKVLDSTTEGPLTWVQIGTPNENFDEPIALSNNIKNITKYNGSYVKIDFYKKYTAGETVTFKYKIHQSYMYKKSWGNVKYSFTPAWFSDIKVKNLIIKWNKDGVKSSDSSLTEDNYLVWIKTNMAKGEKLSIDVKYEEEAFSGLNEYEQSSNNIFGFDTSSIVYIIAVILVAIVSAFRGGGGYYGHRGFYGGGYGGGYYSSCVRSSCACARSSCACACAGSGRAGCSKKDFYGTNINKSKLEKIK